MRTVNAAVSYFMHRALAKGKGERSNDPKGRGGKTKNLIMSS